MTTKKTLPQVIAYVKDGKLTYHYLVFRNNKYYEPSGKPVLLEELMNVDNGRIKLLQKDIEDYKKLLDNHIDYHIFKSLMHGLKMTSSECECLENLNRRFNTILADKSLNAEEIDKHYQSYCKHRHSLYRKHRKAKATTKSNKAEVSILNLNDLNLPRENFSFCTYLCKDKNGKFDMETSTLAFYKNKYYMVYPNNTMHPLTTVDVQFIDNNRLYYLDKEIKRIDRSLAQELKNKTNCGAIKALSFTKNFMEYEKRNLDKLLTAGINGMSGEDYTNARFNFYNSLKDLREQKLQQARNDAERVR